MQVGLTGWQRDQSQLASQLASVQIFTHINLSNIGRPSLLIQVAEPVGKNKVKAKYNK